MKIYFEFFKSSVHFLWGYSFFLPILANTCLIRSSRFFELRIRISIQICLDIYLSISFNLFEIEVISVFQVSIISSWKTINNWNTNLNRRCKWKWVKNRFVLTIIVVNLLLKSFCLLDTILLIASYKFFYIAFLFDSKVKNILWNHICIFTSPTFYWINLLQW